MNDEQLWQEYFRLMLRNWAHTDLAAEKADAALAEHRKRFTPPPDKAREMLDATTFKEQKP